MDGSIVPPDRRTSLLSLAVVLRPGVPNAAAPVGEVTLAGAGRVWRAVHTPGGYYAFSGVPAGDFVLHVRSALHLDRVLALTLPRPDAGPPLMEVTLEPLPSYPFPAGATLVEGMVEAPVPGAPARRVPAAFATVAVPELGLATRSGAGGRFVLVAAGLGEDDVTGGGLLLVPGVAPPSTRITVTARLDGFRDGSLVIDSIREGARTILDGPVTLGLP